MPSVSSLSDLFLGRSGHHGDDFRNVGHICLVVVVHVAPAVAAVHGDAAEALHHGPSVAPADGGRGALYHAISSDLSKSLLQKN